MLEENFNWKKFLLVLFLLAAVALLPQLCKAQKKSQNPDPMPYRALTIENNKQTPAKMDTIAINYASIKNTFSKMSSSGKSVKYYVVYEYNGVEDVTTTGKTVLDYIDICKEAGISPKLALKIKDGSVVSIIKYKSKMK